MNLSLESVIEILNNSHLLEKYNLPQIGIFGSVARHEEANDIDILIEQDVDIKKLINFQIELEELLHTKVDIVMRKYANPIVLHRAKKEVVYVTKQ